MSNMYQGRSGKSYIVNSSPMAKGGEGSIYAIEGNPNSVLKVFRSDRRTSDREEKLIKMVQYQLNDAQLFQVTWPQDVVYDQNGFVGYIMPRLKDNQNLNNVYATGANQFDLRHRMVIAFNLCVAIDTIHSIHQVCGDLNPQNICVDLNMHSSHALCVTLVDTDSYHITDHGKTYRCEVGLANYIAPEVQVKLSRGMNLRSAPLPTYTKETDLFALAVHIFSLVMNGCHPFACAKKTNNGYEHNMDANDCKNVESVVLPQPIDNIKDGFFPFHQQRAGVTYPLYAPDFQALPTDLQKMFIRAFEDGYKDPKKRPTAEEWMGVLGKYQASIEFDKCQKGHYFIKNDTGKCPFCEANQRMMQMLSGAAFENSTQSDSSKQQQSYQQTAYTSPAGNTGNSFNMGNSANQTINQAASATTTGYAQTGKGGFGTNAYQKAMKKASNSTTHKWSNKNSKNYVKQRSNYTKLLMVNLYTSLRAIFLGIGMYIYLSSYTDPGIDILFYSYVIFMVLFVSRLCGLQDGKDLYWENRIGVRLIDCFNCICFSAVIFCWNILFGCVYFVWSISTHFKKFKTIRQLEEQNQRMMFMTPLINKIYVSALVVDALMFIVSLVAPYFVS